MRGPTDGRVTELVSRVLISQSHLHFCAQCCLKAEARLRLDGAARFVRGTGACLRYERKTGNK